MILRKGKKKLMRKSYKALTILATLSLLLSACTVITSSEESKEEPKYKVTWKNFDGSVLEIDDNLEAGTVPTYDGKEPTKAQDAQYNYIFDGWSPKVSKVEADTEYVAVFKEETRKYTVTWKNYDGTVLKEEEVLYGTLPNYVGSEPTKESTVEHTYTFDRWSPAITELKGNAVYTATFKEEARKYNITWKNEDGTVLKSEEVAYGETPNYEELPTKDSTAQYAYTFEKWVPAITAVTGDMTYTASYNSEVRKYTITWVNEDGTVLEVDENVPYGTIPSYNSATPTKDSERGVDYEFDRWSPSVSYVQADKTYTAQFSKKGYFSFEPINYEMEEGYTLDDIQGAPWINSCVIGELEKIKKPSLKDDFYGAVNYDNIRYGGLGPFENCDAEVNRIFNLIYSGAASDSTTNGLALATALMSMADDNTTLIGNYLNGIDASDYLSSRDCFASTSSLLKIKRDEGGYEVEYNDSYINQNFTSLNCLFFYSAMQEKAKSIVNSLSNSLHLNLSDSDINTIADKEYNLSYQAYYNYYYDQGITKYTVNTVPWTPLKNALLDLGLPANAKIKIKNCYKQILNTVYNDILVNTKTVLENMIRARMAFDYRFILGLPAYRDVNTYIAQVDFYFYDDERYLSYYNDYSLVYALWKKAFPILIEQTYIELGSSPEIKAEVAEVIEEVLDGYKQMAQNSWLDSATKQRMISKLDHMDYISCYSDAYRNFAKLGEYTDITTKNNFDILKMYNKAKVDMLLGNDTDDSMYFETMPSYTVNAFYSPTTNAFVILNGLASGMLGETVEQTLGMVGAVIGHEITHAFDSNGANFDEYGNQSDWWSKSDRTEFNKKISKMRTFYNKIELTKDLKVDGGNVDTEATADMGGVKVALTIAKKYENFNYDEFFRSYAFVWCRQPIAIQQVPDRASDSHPFNHLRTNVTLAQFDEFVETYDIGPGDGMYIPENQRVKIW